MPLNPLTNFEIQKCYQNKPKFNVYSRHNLPKIKDETYIINFGEFKSIETHWLALYVSSNNIMYFGVKRIAKQIEKFLRNKNIITNIYKIQAFNSIMYGYFCIGFIDFMLNGKSFLDYKNLFSPNNSEKNDKTILKYFQ